jgi:hypothetical protein
MHYSSMFSRNEILYFVCFSDFPFESFYISPDQNSFICSDPSSSGMTKCSQIRKLRRDNLTCELDFDSSLINKSLNGCINWNQYYQFCAPSDENPFSGFISFDNIGLAWLAIFQVRFSFIDSLFDLNLIR